MEYLKNAREFVRLFGVMEKIIDVDGVDWKTKYNLVFSDDVCAKIRATGIEFEWYDPDMGYDDDVLAYYWAAKEKAEELRKIINALEEE